MIKRRLLIFAALLALGLFFSQRTVQAGPLSASLSEAGFWQLVADSKSAAATGDVQRADLEALAARWEAIAQIETESGASLRVDGSSWAALLRADPSELTRLEALLTRLERERGLFSPIVLPPGSLDRLDEILARPEYQWKSAAPDWLEALWNRLLEWLSGLFGGSAQAQDSPAGIGRFDLFTLLTLVLIAAILAYTLRSLFSDFVSEAELEASAEDEQPLSARTALNRADTLSKAGDYRTAVRYLYLSSLLILDERGLLYYDRTKTNREYLRSLAGNAKVAGLLREVISVFDRVWYGFQPVDEASYQRYAAQVRELENQP